ncbi:hypothetical protein [Anabaena subtropica]|uniref:Uncharacterized protein n=1 Tax=Anabaena subtropica FACHB-260 TaxID=2692884 RepID=A0ABR8CSH7_9NOST|nr:hypothetical protein [Anabaena subtropica]MBD2346146.1 hypothetical protein [Anabaena subtropica FACHB-260]
MNYFSDLISQTIGDLPINLTVVAVNITDPNVVGQMQKVWHNFVQTGQIWALLIGVVIGYMFRNLTKYG